MIVLSNTPKSAGVERQDIVGGMICFPRIERLRTCAVELIERWKQGARYAKKQVKIKNDYRSTWKKRHQSGRFDQRDAHVRNQ